MPARIMGFVLALFVPALTAGAQNAKLGISARDLQETVGTPHEVKAFSNGLEAASGGEKLWLYRGAPGTYFAYGLEQNRVYSRTAMACFRTKGQALEFVAGRVAALEALGWKADRSAEGAFELSSPETVYTTDVVQVGGESCVVLWQAAWDRVRPEAPRNGDRASVWRHLVELAGAVPASPLAAPGSGGPGALLTGSSPTTGTSTPERSAAPDAAPGTAQVAPGDRSEAPLRPNQAATRINAGGRTASYTWIVASLRNRAAADHLLSSYRREGYDAVLVSGALDGIPLFRVGIGRHATRIDLDAARVRLPSDAPADSWGLRITPAMEL